TAGDLDQEGIPNVLKEAMATGMPVISTRHSGIPELIEDGINGALVDERDVDALAGKIIDLAGRPEACREMGQAARKTVEQRFDSNRLNIRLKEMYQEILSIQ
ncbi:MAG: glycosyltransferase, partial [Candidatus Omnitrophica bacterium]|nr:glycosyltransferase [Candidatus Omnitrophota bacterium]